MHNLALFTVSFVAFNFQLVEKRMNETKKIEKEFITINICAHMPNETKLKIERASERERVRERERAQKI